ncbi:aminotransferase class V-fold PLP-dependent enzyme [Clostridium sp.]|uniref:aminotransferase class V-fold PLP-dependent enzyme n=1 Tax=Clostridium sp. TaxID=1506 RepID=UPI002FC5D41B
MSNFIDGNPYRDLVMGINNKVQLLDESLIAGINFDNAATTPPLKCVVEDIIKFCPWYSSIHRGEGYKSQLSTSLYEESRKIIGRFVGYDENNMEVIYVKNATEAINKLSNILCCGKRSNSVILSTSMEHHSNDLPWRYNYTLDYIDIDDKGVLDIKDLKSKLEKYAGRVSLVTVTGASNVTGHKNPVHDIARLAHRYGAKILVDGAQMIPHSPFDMKPFYNEDHIDFLAFSGHKIYAPFGTGVLIGSKEVFNQCGPDYVGGGTIAFVSHDLVKWAASPDRHEAGSPNVIGSVALSSAVEKLRELGMENIDRYERSLTKYATENLIRIPSLILYGDYLNFKDKVSIIPFNIEGIHHTILAKILSCEFGIAVRSGCFCAQPYMQKLLHATPEMIKENINAPKETMPGTVRISFGMYNTFDEIDRFLSIIYKIVMNKNYYLNKYNYINTKLVR